MYSYTIIKNIAPIYFISPIIVPRGFILNDNPILFNISFDRSSVKINHKIEERNAYLNRDTLDSIKVNLLLYELVGSLSYNLILSGFQSSDSDLHKNNITLNFSDIISINREIAHNNHCICNDFNLYKLSYSFSHTITSTTLFTTSTPSGGINIYEYSNLTEESKFYINNPASNKIFIIESLLTINIK